MFAASISVNTAAIAWLVTAKTLASLAQMEGTMCPKETKMATRVVKIDETLFAELQQASDACIAADKRFEAAKQAVKKSLRALHQQEGRCLHVQHVTDDGYAVLREHEDVHGTPDVDMAREDAGDRNETLN